MNKKSTSFPIAAIFVAVSALVSVYSMVSTIGYGIAPGLESILYLCVDLFLLFALVKKDRGILMIAAIACKVLEPLLGVVASFSLGNLLWLLIWLIILVLAVAECQQNVIKLDLSAISPTLRKIFFVPAALDLISFIIFLVNMASMEDVYIPPMTYVNFITGVLTELFLAAWLVNSDKKETPVENVNAEGAVAVSASAAPVTEEAFCSVGKHIALMMFTFGIWNLIWIYRTTKFLNQAPGAQQYGPARKLLLCMFIPFYQIYWFYKHGQRIDALSQHKKVINTQISTVCLVLGIFFPMLACVIMQDRINAICMARND